MRHLTRLAAAGAGLLTAAGIALAAVPAAAGAATISSNFTASPNAEVAYEIASSVQFNQERAVFTIRPHSDLAYGVGLQQSVDGGFSVALAAVPTSDGNYTLEEAHVSGFVNSQPGTPLGSSVTFHPIASSNAQSGILFSQATGGVVYLEARQSTLHGIVNYVEGQGASAETSAATLGTIIPAHHVVFHAPFLGAFGTVFSHGAAKATISRNGVTTPAGVNPMGIRAGTRITFDAFNVDLTQATTTGDSSGFLTLAASPALPGVGSSFGITAPVLAP